MKHYFRKKKLNTSVKVQRLMTVGDVSSAVSVDPVMDFMDATIQNLDTVSCSFDSTAQFEKECIFLYLFIETRKFLF